MKLNLRLTIQVAAGACIQPPDLRTWEVCTMPACHTATPELKHMNPNFITPRWEVGLWSSVRLRCLFLLS